MKDFTKWLGILFWFSVVTLSIPAGGSEIKIEDGRTLFEKHAKGSLLQNLTGDHDQILFVIGENHADVEGQKELAQLIQDLLDAHVIDSILVGSARPITAMALTKQLDSQTLGSSSDWSEYWANLLKCVYCQKIRPVRRRIGYAARR